MADEESVWLDDDEYLEAWFEDDWLWLRPCGLDAVAIRPGQWERLVGFVAARSAIPGSPERSAADG